MGAGKIETPGMQRIFEGISRNMVAQTGPVRKEFLKQGLEALRTGGVKAKIPLIQQAVSQTRGATSQALSQTAEQLAARNIGGPFAGRTLAGIRMGGEQQAAAIPTQVAEQMISGVIPFSQQQASLGLGGITLGAQMRQAADVFNAQQFVRSVPFMQTGQQGIIGGICLHPDTPIETPEGPRLVRDIVVGDTITSVDAEGQKIPAMVVGTSAIEVPRTHHMVALNGTILVSPQHPMPDGSPAYSDPRAVWVGRGHTRETRDLLVDSPTGYYIAGGVVLGSTLDERHRRSLRDHVAA